MYQQLANVYFDFDAEFWRFKARCDGYTMTPPERLYALWKAIQYITRNQIPGDFVECGVWRGGSSMMAAMTLIAEGDTSRRLWLYDTFEGMPPPTERDVEIHSGTPAQTLLEVEERIPARNVWAIAPLDEVRRNLHSTGYPTNNIIYCKGLVQHTLLQDTPNEISILRLDTDWYESTVVELRNLWPILVPCGVLLIDDYGWWKGQRQAVDEFFNALPFKPYFSRIDAGMILVIKP